MWCVVEGEETEKLGRGDKRVASEVMAEVESKQECLRESVEECEVDIVPIALDEVKVNKNESDLYELAEQIGPVKAGSDAKEFSKTVFEDESL